jgi:hypothetical protein
VADELTTEMRIEARKLRAALGAEYRLRQRFAAIEWEENVLKVLDRDSTEQHDQDARMHLWLYFWRNWFTGSKPPGGCVHV